MPESFFKVQEAKACKNLFNKEIPLHVFFCVFREFFRNTFSVEQLPLNNNHEKSTHCFQYYDQLLEVCFFFNVSDSNSLWLLLTKQKEIKKNIRTPALIIIY